MQKFRLIFFVKSLQIDSTMHISAKEVSLNDDKVGFRSQMQKLS